MASQVRVDIFLASLKNQIKAILITSSFKKFNKTKMQTLKFHRKR